MPRSPTVYTLPAGTTVAPNTTIQSSWANALTADIAQTFNTVQPIAYGGTGEATAGAAADALSPAFADVASGATTNIGAATSPNVNITGTTTITAFDSVDAGIKRFVKFAGALTLTHNATSLILPGGANITTAAGDTAIFVSEGSGNWRCLGYLKADGTAVVATIAATQSDQETATSTTTYVSPGRQQFHPSAAKVWIKCDAAGSIQASYNVTSITDDGTGLVTVTIATDFSSANYAITATAFENTTADQMRIIGIAAQAAGSFQGKCVNQTPIKIDPISWYFSAFGDQ